jgi:hypothetical protein
MAFRLGKLGTPSENTPWPGKTTDAALNTWECHQTTIIYYYMILYRWECVLNSGTPLFHWFPIGCQWFPHEKVTQKLDEI